MSSSASAITAFARLTREAGASPKMVARNSMMLRLATFNSTGASTTLGASSTAHNCTDHIIPKTVNITASSLLRMGQILTSQNTNRGYVSQRSSPMNGCQIGPVGASLLAINRRAPRGTCQPALSLTTIASKLAPTVKD
ncbi:hypothetical protein D3C84_833380 [compost metagenome]